MTGPLTGLRIVEVAGIGPGPFCGMLFADMGADVIRVERVGAKREEWNVVARGRRSIAVDMKSPEGVAVVRKLVADADGLIEGFRPGVMERLGLGPDECLETNPKLAYGRMTGWGQTGPLAQIAGHDIDYIAIAGALYGMGDPEQPPRPPQNFLGDYGGGAMFLAFGMLSAILHARETGRGQVIDAAMTDGTALLSIMTYGRMHSGIWFDQRGGNILDGSAPYYGAYECADGQFYAFGPVEPHFSAIMIEKLGLGDDDEVRAQWYEREHWPRLRERIAAIVRTKTRHEWERIFDGTDACAVPVLSMTEATTHPHNVARETFIEVDGVVQPGPAPKFSATPGRVRSGVARPGTDTVEVLAEIGYSADDITRLSENGVVGS